MSGCREGSVVCYHLYRTKDDRFMSLAALEPQFWKNFCRGVGKESWGALAFETTTSDFYREMKALFFERTMSEWEAFGRRYDCCLFPVLNIGEVLDHAYGETRGLVSNKEGRIIVSTYSGAVYQSIVHEQFEQIMKECDEA
ncbi:CoA transferase [Pseudalkalibacillus hwajinpoensis]|uniref:CoA transferase n=1 Tax=Guptibacillus hwajinpoensis TaxID=208199 RepID=UPI00325BB2D0